MHSPILTEVVELAKRAEEEFRMAQHGSALVSSDRAVYLLERVYHAPPAMIQRVQKLITDNVTSGIVLAEGDRAKADQIQARLQRLFASVN